MTGIKAIEDAMPVQVAPEKAAIESSVEDQTPVETQTDSEETTAIKTIEDPMPVEAAILDLRRSTTEDQTTVEIATTSQTTADDVSEGMTSKEPIESDEMTSGTTSDDGTTAMEDKSTIEEPKPVEVPAEESISPD